MVFGLTTVVPHPKLQSSEPASVQWESSGGYALPLVRFSTSRHPKGVPRMKIKIFDTEVEVPDMPSSDIGLPAIAKGLVLILVLAGVWSAVYQIEPEEAGIVLRFGKYVRTTDPGLHFKIPFAEDVQKVPVERQLKQEFGFRTLSADVQTQYSQSTFDGEALMLSGDLNVAVVEWIVQYRIADPYSYLFKVRNVEETFRDMNEAVMREVVGDRTVTEVLTVGRQEIEGECSGSPSGAERPIRDWHPHRTGRPAGRQPTGSGQAVMGRSQPSPAAKGPDDQRSACGLQQRHPAGQR